MEHITQIEKSRAIVKKRKMTIPAKQKIQKMLEQSKAYKVLPESKYGQPPPTMSSSVEDFGSNFHGNLNNSAMLQAGKSLTAVRQARKAA